MFSHLSLGVSELARSAAFYDALLAPLGRARVCSFPNHIGYGPGPTGDEGFAIKPRAGVQPSAGFHLAFEAPSSEAVDLAYAAALANGGRDDGGPGPRPEYGPNYYAAFVLDPDGHRIEVKARRPGS